MTTNTNQTPEQHGADDADSLVADSQVNAADDAPDSDEVARRIIQIGGKEPDSALINTISWRGVYELAGLEYDESADVPSAEAIAWCVRYNAGFSARLAEIATGDSDAG